MSIWSDLLGTTAAYLKIGGFTGVRLKNNSGNLSVRNTDDSADAEITASKVNISGNNLVINSDSAGTGADFKYTLTRPASGMTANVVLTLPIDDGTDGQVLGTNGAGDLSWIAAGDTSLCEKVDTTSLAFGTGSPLALMTIGGSDVINRIEIIVDTAFNGTSPNLSIGIAGNTSKYVASTQSDLTTAGSYIIHPGQTSQGIESIQATYVASGSSAGAARIQVYYATPA